MDLVTQRSLGPFAAAWDSLVARQPYPSPFLRTWWLDATATGEPIYALVLKDSRLIGGLAVQRRRRSGLDIVEMMGQGPLEPDHLDLIAEPGHEATVVEAIGGWLTRPGQRVLDLDGIEPYGLLMAALPPHARSSCGATSHRRSVSRSTSTRGSSNSTGRYATRSDRPDAAWTRTASSSAASPGPRRPRRRASFRTCTSSATPTVRGSRPTGPP